MKPYPTYKPSGINWVGDIPEHWGQKKIKYLVQLINDKAVDKNSFTIALENIQSGNGRLVNMNAEKKIEGEVRQFKTDDILFNKLRPYLCKVYLAEQNGSCVGELLVLRPHQDISPKFMFYRLISSDFIRTVDSSTYGSKMPRASWEDFICHLEIPFPNFSEQNAIATYLDQRMLLIDQLIIQKNKLIDLLQEEKTAVINEAVTKGLNPDVKMKDSGIPWLGEIPKEWEMKKIKHLVKIFGRIGFRGYTVQDLVSEGEGAITISPSNMKDAHTHFDECSYLSWEKYEESPEIMVHNGDILFVKTGSTFGKMAMISSLPEKATINPQLIVFKNINIIPKYFLYVGLSNVVQNQVRTSVIGGTIPTISQEKIGNYLLPVPPISDQKNIVEAIEEQNRKIEVTIFKIEREIELLQEYRTALISEAVTGKIDVREINISE